MTRQIFLHAVLERDLGDDLLQLSVLAAQVFDFVTGGFPGRVASQLLLARFEKVLAPALVEVRGDAFSTAQVGDTLLASESFEHDADLLFRGKLPSASPTDLSHRRFSGLLLLVRHVETLLGVLRTP
jgi:hypothetical protein